MGVVGAERILASDPTEPLDLGSKHVSYGGGRRPVATRMFDRRPAAALADPQARVATIVARHGDLLLRVARQYSLCADDAHDAVQRALEIYT